MTYREELPSRRGTIYDRSGTVVLATSVDRYRLIGAPASIELTDRQKTAQGLVTILGLTGPAAVDLVTKMTGERGYVVLTRGLDEATADRIRQSVASGDLSAVSLEKMTTPSKGGYAFGLGVTTVQGRKLISHSGGIDGFRRRLAVHHGLHECPTKLSDPRGRRS